MNRAGRLLKLLTILRARRSAIVARSLAEQLGVSERTIYRDIQSLISSGVPVEGEAGVGYRLGTGATLPPLMFTEEEMTALILGVRMVQGWCDDELVSAAEAALRKIRSVLPDKALHDRERETATFLVPDLHRQQTTRFSGIIRQAIRRQCVLRLGYTAAVSKSTRTARSIRWGYCTGGPPGLWWPGASYAMTTACSDWIATKLNTERNSLRSLPRNHWPPIYGSSSRITGAASLIKNLSSTSSRRPCQ